MSHILTVRTVDHVLALNPLALNSLLAKKASNLLTLVDLASQKICFYPIPSDRAHKKSGLSLS